VLSTPTRPYVPIMVEEERVKRARRRRVNGGQVMHFSHIPRYFWRCRGPGMLLVWGVFPALLRRRQPEAKLSDITFSSTPHITSLKHEDGVKAAGSHRQHSAGKPRHKPKHGLHVCQRRRRRRWGQAEAQRAVGPFAARKRPATACDKNRMARSG